MPFYRKQFVLILVLALILISSGFYVTLTNMKNMTMLPVEEPLSFTSEDGTLCLKFLGTAYSWDGILADMEDLFKKLRGILAGILPVAEIKS